MWMKSDVRHRWDAKTRGKALALVSSTAPVPTGEEDSELLGDLLLSLTMIVETLLTRMLLLLQSSSASLPLLDPLW